MEGVGCVRRSRTCYADCYYGSGWLDGYDERTLIMPKKKKKNPTITVETHVNGYGLKFDGMKVPGGYMYFTPEELLKGFMIHIGLRMTNELSKEAMQNFITAVCQWNDNAKCLKEIERLNQSLKEAECRRVSLAVRLIAERKHRIGMVNEVNLLVDNLKKYPDKDIRERVENLLKNHRNLVPLSLSKLGINKSDIEEKENDLIE